MNRTGRKNILTEGRGALLRLAVMFLFILTLAGGALKAQAAYTGYKWPVPSSQNMSRGFSSSHDGLDIVGSYGCSIVASKAGTVVELANSCTHFSYGAKCAHWKTYGNYVKIRHSDGTYTVYGHLKKDSIRVKKGQWVSQGQVIAGMGSSGYSTGTHLHFEVRNSKNVKLNVNPTAGVVVYLDYKAVTPPTPTVNPTLKFAPSKNQRANNYLRIYTTLIKGKGQKVTEAGISIWESGQTATTYKESFASKGYYANTTSLPINYQIGAGREVNKALKPGTYYYVSIYCVVNGKRLTTGTGRIQTTGTTPTIVLTPARNTISTTYARVYSSLKKSKGMKCTLGGIAIMEKNGRSVMYKEKYSKYSNYVNSTVLPINYQIGKGREVNYTLKRGTTYYYTIFADVDGVRYTAKSGSFRTKS